MVVPILDLAFLAYWRSAKQSGITSMKNLYLYYFALKAAVIENLEICFYDNTQKLPNLFVWI